MIELSTIFMFLGFTLAAVSVVGNDSLQVLGTFIASNRHVKWYNLWIAASTILVGVVLFGWFTADGSISYERLTKIPFQEIQWYHAMAPGILLILTRYGIPVSTSLLVLSVFASGIVLEKILIKSFLGYGVAAIAAYVIWIGISKFLNEKVPVKEENKKYWVIGQWGATGLLWATWLTHDIANIAVFLPRSLSLEILLYTLTVFVLGLGYIFYRKGGKIQEIVLDKSGTRFIRSATLIDLVYFFILWFFKELNNIPMSTTFVFVGLIMGRELAIYSQFGKKIKTVFPVVAKDFAKLMFGLAISVSLVLLIQQVR